MYVYVCVCLCVYVCMFLQMYISWHQNMDKNNLVEPENLAEPVLVPLI